MLQPAWLLVRASLPLPPPPNNCSLLSRALYKREREREKPYLEASEKETLTFLIMHRAHVLRHILLSSGKRKNGQLWVRARIDIRSHKEKVKPSTNGKSYISLMLVRSDPIMVYPIIVESETMCSRVSSRANGTEAPEYVIGSTLTIEMIRSISICT